MRALILVAAFASTAAAAPVVVSAGSHGSMLDLTFTNTTKQPVTLTTHVRAGIDHYDWLTVELTGKAKRTLEFVEARTKAIPIDETIAPGGKLVKSVDLVFWAIRQGDALEPGDYDVTATWNAPQTGKAVAKAKLTIAGPKDKPCTQGGTGGIELLAHQVGNTNAVEFGLHNTDTRAHCVLRSVAHGMRGASEQSKWLTVAIDKRTLRFAQYDDQLQSAPNKVELPPGATTWLRFDVAAWAGYATNGSKPLPAGTYWATATYDATGSADSWSGKVSTNFALLVR
jgi:hypothetical protein